MSNNQQSFVIVDGIKFYPTEQGYWLGHVGGKPKRLHVYNYEKVFGPVPKGFDIHHIDHDPSNNNINNLILVSRSDHNKAHAETRHEIGIENIKRAQAAAVEWHKGEAGHEWHKEQYEKTLRDKWDETVTKNCEVCGKPFTVSVLVAYKSRFCSNNCKSQFRRNSGIDNVTVHCEICGTPFETNKYSKQRFCSDACRAENRLRKKRLRETEDIVV